MEPPLRYPAALLRGSSLKKEPESLVCTGLKIPRDYIKEEEENFEYKIIGSICGEFIKNERME